MSKKPPKPESTDDLADLSYEDAAERVEAISDRIESGEIGLEESLAQYEQAMKLLAHCKRILDRAEQRITELTPDDAAQPDDED